MHKLALSLAGSQFPHFRVLEDGFRDKFNHLTSRCVCECGNEFFAITTRIYRGGVSSCGCLRSSKIRAAKTVHGHSSKKTGFTPTYNSWYAMHRRCKTRKTYLQRGTRVCKRWKSFVNFLADMGERPEGKTLDRIDNGGDYTPSNCRWASPSEQSYNTSTNKLLTYEGETKCLAEWSVKSGVNYHTLHYRVLAGWSAERALTTPPYRRR